LIPIYHSLTDAFFQILNLIGPLGELWVVLPLAAALAVWCLASGDRRGSLVIVVVTVVTLAATVFLKLVSVMAGPPWQPHWDWISSLFPSGHMAMGTVVYGTLTVCVSRAAPRLGMGLAVIVIAMMTLLGIQRVVFEVHPILDVIGGSLLGIAGLAILLRAWPRGTLRPAGILLVGVVVVLILHTFYGREVPSAQMLERMSARIHAAVDAFKTEEF